MSRRTPDTAKLQHDFAYGGVTLFAPAFKPVRLSVSCYLAVHTPPVFLRAVWASPISLATTFGIVITFFSSGY